MNFKLGDRVTFVADANDPFPGQMIAGEVVMLDEANKRVAVYRDPKWRTADAAWTWMDQQNAQQESP